MVQGVVRCLYAAPKLACKGAALPWLPWPFALLFAGVLRKSMVAIATSGSVAHVSPLGSRWGRGFGAHMELRRKFSLLMRFTQRIPVLVLLLSFPIGLSWARQGDHY